MSKILTIQNLKVTIVQADIVWEAPRLNLDKLSRLIEQTGTTDLIILPEMFTTGFTTESEKLKEAMDGPSVHWMKMIAAHKGACITGSLIIDDGGKTFNRAVWVFPDGRLNIYNKRHLYTMGQEHLYYTPGKEKTIIEYKGWKFCPQICYDLRFPVFSRNLEDYDVLFYMANWPSPRHHVWKNLLVSRAIENQSYCFGINRIGTDGTGLNYRGDSAFVSPKGIARFLGKNEQIKTFTISLNELKKFRQAFPVLSNRDFFEITK